MLSIAQEMASKCKSCKFCQLECQFLKDNGMPKAIAEKLLAGELDPALAFECNQCGLCTQVCTVRGLDPSSLFTAMRVQAMRENPSLKKPHNALLAFEKIGLSKAMSYFHAPEGATTLLFPGCNLPGTRPDLTWACFEKLREADPKLGLALHCCSRPSKSLGLMEQHETRLADLVARIEALNIREVLVMCPSCLTTLKGAEPSFSVRTVYEVLAGIIPEPPSGMERIRTGVHDPCVIRGERQVHESVRTLLWNTGSSVTEMGHSMHKAFCCGVGSGVETLRPDYAQTWRERRKAEATNRRVVTYCGGCVNSLSSVLDVTHVLDMVLMDSPKPAKKWATAPRTYANRLLLKKKAKSFFAKG